MSSKPENPTYTWLELDTLPSIGHTFLHNQDFLLADNFPEYIKDWESRPQAAQYHETYPVRINFTLIVLCLKGSMSVQVNMSALDIRANEVLIASPGDITLFKSATEDLQYLVIGIKNPMYFDLAGKEMTIDLRKLLMHYPVFPLSESDSQAFRSIYVLMGRKISEEQFPFKDDLIRGYLSVMSVYGRQWILDHARQHQGESRQEELFNRFMEELNLHFREEHEVAFYADKLCITPKYMSQLIYQASGHFANEWIRDHIILEAKALLKSGKYTVLQVSEILNFPNSSFFSQYFKRNVGCTPKQYMNA